MGGRNLSKRQRDLSPDKAGSLTEFTKSPHNFPHSVLGEEACKTLRIGVLSTTNNHAPVAQSG